MTGQYGKKRTAIGPSDKAVLWCWEEAKKVARGMAPEGRLDQEGRDNEDYATLLLLRAWSAVWAYRCRHWDGLDPEHLEAERRYVYRALYNERASLQRQAKRRAAIIADLQSSAVSDPASRLDARFTLGALQSNLSSGDLRILFGVAMAGGVVAEAYDGATKKRTFYAQVHRARVRARQVAGR